MQASFPHQDFVEEQQTALHQFFSRDAVLVAAELVGWSITVNGIGGRIVETEAYRRDDEASHSYRGLGSRNSAMFGPSARAYVYRIYGLHYCLNFVCADAGAVLIRALEPGAGIETMRRRRGNVTDRNLANGPGKLCAALGVDLSLDGSSLFQNPFSLTPGKAQVLITGPRIGISRNRDAPWRFADPGSPNLSRPFLDPIPDGTRRTNSTGTSS